MRILIFCCCCLSCFFAQTQSSLLTIIEESTTSKNIDTLLPTGVAIVDINSRLILQVDIAEVEDQMFQYQGISARDERLAKLRKLNELMRSQNRILNLINSRFANRKAAGATLSDYKELATLVDDVFEEIENDDEILDIVQSDAFEQRFSNAGADANFPLIVFEVLSEQAQAIRESLLDEIVVDGKRDSSLMVYFRLGAFLKNRSGGRPVHVENFDDLTPDEYIEIERFGAPLSEEEETALIQNKNLRDSLGLNMDQLGGFMMSSLRAKAQELFPSDTTKLSFRKLYLNTLSALNLEAPTRPAAQVLLENEINLDRVNSYYQFAAENFDTFVDLFSKDRSTSGRNYLQIFKEFSTLVARAYVTYHQDVEVFGENSILRNSNGEIPGLIQLERVDTSYSNYEKEVQNDISAIQNLITEVERLLTPFRKSYLANEEFGEEVRRFQAGDIPPVGYIELKGIGERRAGDEIVIRAVLERGADKSNRNFQPYEIYRRYISIARVEPHLKMSGSLVLANPYNRQNEPQIDLENTFQFAPSYHIYMKWGSRRSKFFNDFLTPGIGLSFSSPDFDTDGIPEFGAGITASFFRDIIGVGWSWNFGLDTPYQFISFNIPFTVGGLPGLNTATGIVEQ